MTATIGTSSNLQTGITQYGLVTNSYAGYMTSGGIAYSLQLPFVPDSFEWFRYTGFDTAGVIASGIWFRDFPAGDALENQTIADNGATGNKNNVLETTNGVTLVVTPAGFTTQYQAITGLTAATPGVVTVASTALYSSGQRVIITQVQGTIGASVNNMEFVIQVLGGTTFALYDVYGNPYPTAGSYTGSTGQVTLEGPSLFIENSPQVNSLTLGTSVMGAGSDVIYFRAFQYNSYYNLGTV